MAVERLTALGWGIVMFAIVIGLGLLVLTKFAASAGTGDANTAIVYIMGQLGSSGLAGWLPVIIVVVVAGLIFLLFGGSKKGGY